MANTLSADAPGNIRAIFDRCTFHEYSNMHATTHPVETDNNFSPSISSSTASDYSACLDPPTQADVHLMSDDEDYPTRSVYDSHHRTNTRASQDNLRVHYDDEGPLEDKNSGADFSHHSRHLKGDHHHYSASNDAHDNYLHDEPHDDHYDEPYDEDGYENHYE